MANRPSWLSIATSTGLVLAQHRHTGKLYFTPDIAKMLVSTDRAYMTRTLWSLAAQCVGGGLILSNHGPKLPPRPPRSKRRYVRKSPVNGG